MKHYSRTLAKIAALASTSEELFKSPVPLRRDKLGRQIFADGSWLDHNLQGEPICGHYSLAEWLYQEMEAWRLGRKHRLGRKRMHQAFRNATQQFPKRICRAYVEGFFSVPSWPGRTSE